MRGFFMGIIWECPLIVEAFNYYSKMVLYFATYISLLLFLTSGFRLSAFSTFGGFGRTSVLHASCTTMRGRALRVTRLRVRGRPAQTG